MLGKQNKCNPTDHLVQWMNKSIHIALLIGLLVSVGLLVSPEKTYAHHDDNDLIKTVYHVYLDGEEIGTVHHKSVVEKYLEKRMEDAQSKVKNQVSFNEKIEYTSERMFQPKYDEAAVIKELEHRLSVAVDAVAVSVDGEIVGYLKNEEVANDLLRKLKLEYVPEGVLTKLEQSQTQPLEAGKEETNDSNILAVRFSKNVALLSETTSIGNIMSPEDLMALLKKGSVEEKIHIVVEGDVLGSIAEEYNLTTKELVQLNEGLDEDSLIHIGQELVVTGLEPYIKVVVEEKVTQNEEIPFKVEYKEDSSMPKGDTKTKREGKAGEKNVTYKIMKENGTVVKKEVVDSKTLSEPVSKIVLKGTKVIPSRGTGQFAWPAVGGYISSGMGSRWGSYHKGIDIARPANRTIKAADNGTVVQAGWDSGGYGNRIVISHNNGYKTTYSHLNSIKVRVGQVVSKGQSIGIMGRTGNSTGVHLHFEVYKNGGLVNPISVLSR